MHYHDWNACWKLFKNNKQHATKSLNKLRLKFKSQIFVGTLCYECKSSHNRKKDKKFYLSRISKKFILSSFDFYIKGSLEMLVTFKAQPKAGRSQ